MAGRGPYRAEWSPDLGAYDDHPAPGWSLPVPAEARPPVLPVLEEVVPADGQAEVEARILLPARKDR